ncbi:uncharacterized protein YidB (DUF937 family) [Allocatelliglobosispora scoriae]|uniref:Uncharacterized protein YidB (DUF937 family) n=1 Tax=Allocatelliglobosispora scoriae TaxID=643052 RepID=A0A841C268_9ACTN|nr:YidB family protein [Allocatelliglobosispora scoriae]MBB5873233.1 uncharacterized protein YidB (DUF937 family) [Allocatelliglobosispora scoriae]
MQLLQNPQVQQMVQGLLKQMTGGKSPDVSQLLNQLTSSGLGGQAQSWVGTGDNEPITGEQLQEALGTDAVTQVAEKAGIAPEAAANELANVLPGLVDTLSPNGELPNAQSLQDQLTKLFGTPSGPQS